MNEIKKADQSTVVSKVLDWAYNKAINGLTGIDSAINLAEDYLNEKGSLDQQVDALIRWQVAKAGSSGFFTGLGGWALLPFTFPANVASVIYIQVRMISAIAYMGGYDIKSDKVKSLIFICMLGNGSKEILKEVSIKAGKKAAKKLIESTSKKMAQSVSEKVGFNVVSKLGGKSLANLSKALPLVGGVIGGSFDASSTFAMGKIAKQLFINNNNDLAIVEIEEIETATIV